MPHVPEELMHEKQTKMRLGYEKHKRFVKMAHDNELLHSVFLRALAEDTLAYWEEHGELPDFMQKKHA
jgi:hypothetical protein